MKVLGVVTARAGSKGLPGKNLRPLGSKPLLAYTIEAARQSGVLDRVILSTEDQQIADVGREYGCDVPFIRPRDLAQDDTPHLPVIQHAVKWMAER
ncbi:MAG TPA: acylneuraminate cytidylyltransferase family protein, partial [Vicinamibacterales bacterium]|nr:acylneuraminate cytidylyltransferase family protein [Vicinamibacterales bacterium]